MNAHIANLILQRIVDADLPWLDKYAGLTRTVERKDGTVNVRVPVSCGVEDPLHCGTDTLLELSPDEQYASILFIEGDPMPRRQETRGMGVRYISSLRVVVWMNCTKLGGGCDCGAQASMNLIAAIEKGNRSSYATSLFRGIRHTVVGGETRGAAVFSNYTFDAANSQYLNYPFDAFAIDVETEFAMTPGCEEQLALDNTACWPPPTSGRRLYPREFTCEQLTDPANGLTAEQLGAGCLDCAGDSGGDPVTIRTTDQGTVIDQADAGTNYDLPQTKILYTNANGGASFFTPADTNVDNGLLTPEQTIPRFQAMTSDGTTVVVRGDIASPDVSLPQTRISYKDELNDDQVTGPLSTGYSAGSLIPAGQVPRQELTLNGVPTGLFVTLDRLILGTIPNITTPAPSGIRYALSQTMWSGQETVYATGDEGSLYASEFFDYIGPSLPVHITRLVDWFTLYDANIFGNTNRFTDRLGGQTYSDRIIMDHYTGLEWYSPAVALTGTWNVAIGAGVALNYGGNTDWRIAPLGVLQTIIRTVTGQLLNYAPFSIPAGTVWSSTTNVTITTNAIPMISNGTYQSTAKFSSGRYIFMRRFA